MVEFKPKQSQKESLWSTWELLKFTVSLEGPKVSF